MACWRMGIAAIGVAVALGVTSVAANVAELTDEMVPAAPRGRAPATPVPAPLVAETEPPLPETGTESVRAGSGAPAGPVTALPDRAVEEEAFRALLRSMLPMDEEQLRRLRRLLDRQALVLAEPPSGVEPRAVTRAVQLTLRPGEPLARLRLFPGNATSVTFSDVTGAPWPIQSVTVGNPQAFAASEAGERGRTNMLVISPLTSRIVANNVVVALAGHPVPVVLGIEAGGEEVDFRVDVTIRARGPNAAPEMVRTGGLSATNDRVVQAFLDGVPPREAVSLRTSHRDVEAWRYQGRMFVRSAFEIMSPAYEARARNVSGVNVFTLGDTPVLLMADGGRLFSVTVRDAGQEARPAPGERSPASGARGAGESGR